MVENERYRGFTSLINNFLSNRREEKLKTTTQDKLDEIRDKFRLEVWLEDAAKRSAQLKIVTHTIKAVHPDARGSNFYCNPRQLVQNDFAGSHLLADDFNSDVVGNAAALDVYKFLRLEYDGKILLDWLEAGDADALDALSPDREKSSAWAKAFCGLRQCSSAIESHTLAKQLYWLVGDDPVEDAHFHLLAPLYASSLAHMIYETIQEDRFGEPAKQAREARKKNVWHDKELHDYPNLAAQKFGGTNPQNISQLNSERCGVNYLLPSLPPAWKSRSVRPPRGKSLFDDFVRRNKEAAKSLKELKVFLESNPPVNKPTRDKRDDLLRQIIDAFLEYTMELRSLPPGWSLEPGCLLPQAEKHWLDPLTDEPEIAGDMETPANTMEEIIHRFANWINSKLGKNLPTGVVEYVFWGDALEDSLKESGYE